MESNSGKVGSKVPELGERILKFQLLIDNFKFIIAFKYIKIFKLNYLTLFKIKRRRHF